MSPFDGCRVALHFSRSVQVRLWAVAGFMLLAAWPVAARADHIKPVPPAECAALKQFVEKISGLKLSMAELDPDDELFALEQDGLACVISGEGTGATHQFGDVSTALSAHFKGWKPLLDLSADGPGSTRMGFTKGKRTVIYSISAEPPEGKCEVPDDAVELPECQLPAGEWEWAVDLIAYEQGH